MNFGRSSSEHEDLILPYEVGYKPLPRQVVTLGFLSGQIPPQISELLARSLCGETNTNVVLVRLEPHDSATNENAAPEFFLNGEFHLPATIRKTEHGFYSLTLGLRSDPPTPAGINSLIRQLSRRFRHVLIETSVLEQPAPWFTDLLLRSDLAYLFFRPTTEDVFQLDQIMRETRPRSRNGGVHLKPIACLAEGERINGFDALTQRVASPVHLFVHGCPKVHDTNGSEFQVSPKSLFHKDLRRLAREIGGCLVGLALSSGAAKGFAHIGVIQVLEENGIEVDIIAGTSMGAYVGACWAYGCDGPELERLARELEGRWSLWSLIDPAFPPRRGFLRGFAVKKRLMRSLGDAHFGDLVRPMRIVAANLATLERMVFSGGEVAAAVHASIAVPGICVPITIDGETYTDGGIVDPLPVDVLREMGVSRILAVNVIPTPDRIRYGLQAELELARHKQQKQSNGFKLFRKVAPLDRQVNYFARGNLLEILMRSVHGAQTRMAEESSQRADLVLRPDIYDDCWLDYNNPGKFIKLGREVAERHLDEIKSLVARKEAIHEQELAPESMAALI
jgi:NTE family protein